MSVAGLPKNHEEIFPPDQPDPVILPRSSDGLYLMQRIRDEAHRFALRQHQTQRRMTGLASQLDSISGIGPARRKALIRAFGSIDGVRQAPGEDPMKLPDIPPALAHQGAPAW